MMDRNSAGSSVGRSCLLAVAVAVVAAACPRGALAQQTATVPFTLSTVGSHADGILAPAQVNNSHGCKGSNMAPDLLWSAPPAGTKSFAVTVFDETARKGVGFWHWAMFDLPPATRTLTAKNIPAGAKSGRNDFGQTGYGGACPPAGDPAHTYDIAVWALADPTLKFDAGTPDAEIGAYLKAHALGHADLTFTYKR